jgi:Carboxypeptidase regulatory-like domain
MRSRWALALIGFSLVAVAGASAASRASGLHGAVIRGPITPVCRVGVPCGAPAPYVTLTFSRAGLARKTRTDQQGAYRIGLPPGIYSVRTSSKPFGHTPHPATVHVRADRNDKIVFTIDTGIR